MRNLLLLLMPALLLTCGGDESFDESLCGQKCSSCSSCRLSPSRCKNAEGSPICCPDDQGLL